MFNKKVSIKAVQILSNPQFISNFIFYKGSCPHSSSHTWIVTYFVLTEIKGKRVFLKMKRPSNLYIWNTALRGKTVHDIAMYTYFRSIFKIYKIKCVQNHFAQQ